MSDKTKFEQLKEKLKDVVDEVQLDIWEHKINNSDLPLVSIQSFLESNDYKLVALKDLLEPQAASLKLNPLSSKDIALQAANDTQINIFEGVRVSYKNQNTDQLLNLDANSKLLEKMMAEQAFWEQLSVRMENMDGFVLTRKAKKSLVQFSGYTGMNQKKGRRASIKQALSKALNQPCAKLVAANWVNMLSSEADNLFAAVGNPDNQSAMWQMANELMLQDEALDQWNDEFERQVENRNKSISDMGQAANLEQNVYGQVISYQSSAVDSELDSGVLDIMLHQHSDQTIIIEASDPGVQKGFLETLLVFDGPIHFEFASNLAPDLQSLYDLVCFKQDNPGKLRPDQCQVQDDYLNVLKEVQSQTPTPFQGYGE